MNYCSSSARTTANSARLRHDDRQMIRQINKCTLVSSAFSAEKSVCGSQMFDSTDVGI